MINQIEGTITGNDHMTNTKIKSLHAAQEAYPDIIMCSDPRKVIASLGNEARKVIAYSKII